MKIWRFYKPGEGWWLPVAKQSGLIAATKIAGTSGKDRWFSNKLLYFTHMNGPIKANFTSRAVADLAWMIYSAPLLDPRCMRNGAMVSSDWCTEQWTADLQWILDTDLAPGQLEAALQAAPTMLGRRFEALVHYWLSVSPRFQLLHHYVQLTDGRKTVGELDFIFREVSTGVLFHLEVACKYFLCPKPGAHHANWLGVNSADTLAEKFTALERQSALSATASGLDFLVRHGLEKPQSLIMLKGYFFYPYDRLGNCPAPRCASKAHSSGWWMKRRDVHELADTPGLWQVLPRERWIAPWQWRPGDPAPLSGSELIGMVRNYRGASHGIMVVQADPLTGVSELSRGMIVPDSWPAG